MMLADLRKRSVCSCDLEDLAVVGALAFKHRGAIVQAMGEHMHLGIAPGDDFAVEPDHAVAVVERNDAMFFSK